MPEIYPQFLIRCLKHQRKFSFVYLASKKRWQSFCLRPILRHVCSTENFIEEQSIIILYAMHLSNIKKRLPILNHLNSHASKFHALSNKIYGMMKYIGKHYVVGRRFFKIVVKWSRAYYDKYFVSSMLIEAHSNIKLMHKLVIVR